MKYVIRAMLLLSSLVRTVYAFKSPSMFRNRPILANPLISASLSSATSSSSSSALFYTNLDDGVDDDGRPIPFLTSALPPSLHDSTAYISNLPEFLSDSDLKTLLSEKLHSTPPPLEISRSLDTSSLRYGFIIFQSPSHQTSFISQLSNTTLSSATLPNVAPFTFKVEPYGAKDSKTAKVPARLIDFVLGTDQRGVPRRTHEHQQKAKRRNLAETDGKVKAPGRISRDDVVRLSRGQPSKVRGRGSRGVPHRLNEEETGEFERSCRRGYLRLDGTGYRRGRKGSPLANTHRQHCDSRAIPQIVLMKASGGRMLDNVVVDLSPLRVLGEGNRGRMDEIVRNAAEMAGVGRCEHEDEGEGGDYDVMDDLDNYDFVNEPVWKLPTVVSVGVFEGERSKCQKMCKILVDELGIVKEDVGMTSKKTYGGSGGGGGGGGGGPKNRRDAGAKGGGKTKPKKNKRRSRGGGRSPEDSIRGLF